MKDFENWYDQIDSFADDDTPVDAVADVVDRTVTMKPVDIDDYLTYMKDIHWDDFEADKGETK